MPKPPGALTGDSSGSILDPNPCPSRRTMNQRRWRARRRGEYVPEGAFYPALTKAGRPRKGAPRPVFELPTPSPDPIEERQSAIRQELEQTGTLIEHRHLSFGDVVALFEESPTETNSPGDQPGHLATLATDQVADQSRKGESA